MRILLKSARGVFRTMKIFESKPAEAILFGNTNEGDYVAVLRAVGTFYVLRSFSEKKGSDKTIDAYMRREDVERLHKALGEYLNDE